MSVAATPFRLPPSWKGQDADALLKGAAFQIVRAGEPAPAGVLTAKGVSPGVRMSRGRDRAEAGPTGVPWVDSNGWLVRLNRALHPQSAVWIDAPATNRYELAIADAAAHGGRWIVSFDDALATGIAARNSEAMGIWKRIAAASSFFAAHAAWDAFVPQAVVGVISDFTGPNQFLGQELLNLLARAGQHYRVVCKDHVALDGLRAIVYADQEPPSAPLRQQALAFVEAGGLLITVPKWGSAPGRPLPGEHPRFDVRAQGKGRIAIAHSEPGDPYQLASDAAILISHRHDLIRFWNGGACGSYYAMSPDRTKAVAHLLFYADRPLTEASVRIAGRYRTARMLTFDHPDGIKVEAQFQKDAVEVRLPQVSDYVAIELEV